MPTKTAAKPTPKSTTTRKATTTKKAPVKTAPKPAVRKTPPKAKTPAVSVVKETQAAPVGNELKKRELIDLVVERSDVKKRFAKPVVEAMIEILGEALAAERGLNLQPMGRVLPQRTKDVGKNRVIVARIRQSKERTQEAVAKAAE